MTNIAIVLAGGFGARFGERKQFVDFMGKPVYMHVYEKAVIALGCENVVVVGVDIPGGLTRSHSVINGLKHFKQKGKKYNKVLIMEAARPLVTIEQIRSLIDANAPSVTFVQPLVNTIIKKDVEFVNRNDYFELLTPQCFDFELLYKAYIEKSDWDMTDETRVIYEKYKIKPKFIEGGQNLTKLTYIKDLPYLEHLFRLQQEGVFNENKNINNRREWQYSNCAR